ncbi:MAG: helix-turn-helix domain-containing protein [Aureispira sp.]
MNIDIAIANVLRSIREKNKLSQEQLAFKAQLHRTYISQIERGLKSVTVKTLFKLTEALDVEIDFFLKKVKDELTSIQS